MTPLKKLEQMSKANLIRFGLVMHENPLNYWGSRYVLELQYAWKLSESEGGAYASSYRMR